jgi:hypothetical protein
VLDQHCRGKIEMRPAFAQQLGYVADVHRGRHEFSSIRAKTVPKGKQTILPQKSSGCQIIRLIGRAQECSIIKTTIKVVGFEKGRCSRATMLPA